MSTFETAFAAWLLFISNLGVDPDALLLPPASPADVKQVEEKVGFELPDDFVNLYMTTNGQLEPYWAHKDFTGTYCPLFGWYELIPLDKVLTEYQQQLEWYQEELPNIFDAEVREGDPIAAVAWQPGWIPFAVSNAAYYAVDLSPIRGGTYGQVIEYGHDTSENRVLASSLTEFLELATRMLDPEEPHRYSFEPANPDDPHGRAFNTLYFDMDWQQTPEQPVDSAMLQDPEMDDWNEANHAAVDAFLAWLENRGFTDKERDAFRTWAFESIMPMSSIPGLLSPPMPDDSPLSAISRMFDDPLVPLISLELALRGSTNYIVEDLPVTLEDAFTLLHEYRVEMGEWSQQQFEAAARIIKRDRPPRSSITDEDYSVSGSSVDTQPDGSRLLCLDSYSDSAELTRECIRFSSDDLI